MLAQNQKQDLFFHSCNPYMDFFSKREQLREDAKRARLEQALAAAREQHELEDAQRLLAIDQLAKQVVLPAQVEELALVASGLEIEVPAGEIRQV